MTKYRLEGLQPLVTIPPPENVLTNSSDVRNCSQFDFNYDLTTSVICVMYLLFGVIYSMFGYRCFKAVMFLTGFFFGSVVVYLICLEEELLPTYGNAGVALGAGILFGLITMLVQYVGLFMTGFHSGLFMGVVAIVVMQEWYQPGTIWIVVGLLLGSGLLMAMLTLYWQKGLTIFGTCLYGGAVMMASIDYFVEKFLTLYWIWDKIKLTKESAEPCWYGLIILSVWPLVFLLGLIVQWAITGTGQHHYELRPSKSRKVNLQRIRTREERAEARQKKYRYLYQIRTAHGDIISQVNIPVSPQLIRI